MSEEFEILVVSETCHGHGNSIKAVTRQCIATKTQGARSHLVSLEVIRISFTMKNIILLDAINLKLLWIFQGIFILDGQNFITGTNKSSGDEPPPPLSQNPCNLGFLHSH